ncbi:integrase core domain-containing protein [Nocardioides humi]
MREQALGVRAALVASHVASHVADGETSAAAIVVFDKAVAAHGVPQRLLSDNQIKGDRAQPLPTHRAAGSWANSSSTCRPWVSRRSPASPTRPYNPTTQGKNERFHQTLSRSLDKQPLAATLAGLQAQVDAFDRTYNTERGCCVAGHR